MATLPRGWTAPPFSLGVVFIVALVLRLIMVFHGGQYFWADETRYDAAAAAWDKWAGGEIRAGWLEIVGSADHLGFKLLMLGPAWIQRHWPHEFRIVAAIISLFSLANIFWIWCLARRTGAGEREALWAAMAMAGANSMFYWARHLVPYDVALFWALACAYVALKPAPRRRDSLLAGMLGCAAFLTYNGYWAIVACALVAHVLLAAGNWRAWGRRAGFGLLGLAAPFALLLVVTKLLQIDLLRSYVEFAGTVKQGDFFEGHDVLFGYLWHSERFTLVIWVAALGAMPWLWRRADYETRRRGLLWAGTVVALGAILIAGSNLFGIFVVYGRLVRQVVPFCALLVGWSAAQIFRESRAWRWPESLALVVLAASGLWNQWTPLRQDFPLSFHLRARQAASAYRRDYLAAEPDEVAWGKFRFLYNGFIWPYPDEKPLPPHYDVLLASPHPLSWRPYLYEGFNRVQRNRIEETDITMRVIVLKD